MNKVVLSSIIEIISGGTPKTSVKEYWENGQVGWLSVTDFNDDSRFVYTTEKKITELGARESNTKYLEKGDIIISARGTVGALAQIGVPMCFNQSCFGIRGKKGIVDTDFLYYALKNYVKNIVLRSQGSVFNTINLKSFDLMEIQIPSEIEAQKNIATVLSSLDSKIELNNRINAELEAMAKTIYDYWFVQFDFPISAGYAASVGQPELEGKPYKSSGGEMVWNGEIKREVPKGWEVKPLGGIEPNIVTGKTPSTKDRENFGGDVPFVCIGDVRGNMHVVKTEISLSRKGADSQKKKYLPAGSLCVTCIASPGLVAFTTKEAQTNQQINSIVSEEPKVLQFLYFALKDFFQFAKGAKTGNTFANMNKGDFAGIHLFWPSEDILQHFSSLVSPSFDQIKNLSLQNQELASLRDWLLPMLMNGQVKVGEAKEYVQEGEPDSDRVGIAAVAGGKYDLNQ